MLTSFILGLFASSIALWAAPRPRTLPTIVEALFSYFPLFSIACSFFLLVRPALSGAGRAVTCINRAPDFTPGNAGIVFYGDIFGPVVGLPILWPQRRAALQAGRLVGGGCKKPAEKLASVAVFVVEQIENNVAPRASCGKA
jgi:hypothetical protein